jgi:methyltransferase (TIGR00027 family)
MENEGHPSQTAMTAAAARAAHLLVDSEPRIFADSLAALLLGDQAETYIRYHREYSDHPLLAGTRAQATCRSRFTEDQLALAAAGGTAQYVILGAGLDSFAYRSELAGRLRVFEVDHPATQQRKRALLAAAELAEPPTLTWVPADFETDELTASLTGLLTRHGFTGVRDVRQRDAVSAALWERTDLLRPIELSRLCHATVGAGR